jgi:hypothetical protein
MQKKVVFVIQFEMASVKTTLGKIVQIILNQIILIITQYGKRPTPH